MEPNWEGVKSRLARMTMRQLKAIGRNWFGGCMGGISRKSEYVDEMVIQMRYWWRSCADTGGRARVRNVLADIDRAEREAE